MSRTIVMWLDRLLSVSEYNQQVQAKIEEIHQYIMKELRDAHIFVV